MSVLIRDMEMPTSCDDCYTGFCKQIGCDLKKGFDEYNISRHPDCPLIFIQQHGRLIDADRLENIVFKSLNNAITDCNPTPFGEALCTFIAKNIVDEIEGAPTIIQADKPKIMSF